VSLEAVIFDCDGVLVDSEPLAWRAWTQVLAGYGYEPTPEDILRLLGRTTDEILDYFSFTLGEVDRAEIVTELNTVMGNLFDRHLEAFEDGAALVAAASARGLRVAVASSSRRERVLKALELTSLRHFFDVIVTADDVASGKPAPDVYVEAVRRLGVPPRDCLAVEDSEHGVRSAIAAGLPVVAVVRSYTQRDAVTGASVVVGDLSVGLLDMPFTTTDSEGLGPREREFPTGTVANPAPEPTP
jgi:HAD superfamily hydrolase (TIGR01509 family)